jgi:citrate lyase beta subunit
VQLCIYRAFDPNNTELKASKAYQSAPCTSLFQEMMMKSRGLGVDLSTTHTPSLPEFLFARSAIVTACRAHDLSSATDLISTDYKGERTEQELTMESLDGKNLGFTGSSVSILHKSRRYKICSVLALKTLSGLSEL